MMVKFFGKSWLNLIVLFKLQGNFAFNLPVKLESEIYIVLSFWEK